jgi:hypothetical protein
MPLKMLMYDSRMPVLLEYNSIARTQHHMCSCLPSMQIYEAAGTDDHHSSSYGNKRGLTKALSADIFLRGCL